MQLKYCRLQKFT